MAEERAELKGGSYAVLNGERVLVERTQDHPDGNRGARDAKGNLRNAPPPEAPAAPAPEQPAVEPVRRTRARDEVKE